MPCKDLAEEGAKKQPEHPRPCSAEPMEINMTTLKDAKVRDIDSEDINAEFSSAEYAKEINKYLKKQEVLFLHNSPLTIPCYSCVYFE